MATHTSPARSSWKSRPAAMNVGWLGGDLAARKYSLGAMALLTVLSAPLSGASYSTVKIVALLAGMSGTLFLMAGLVFVQKTHFAGLTLLPGSLAILSLVRIDYRWSATLVGAVLGAAMLQNLMTRRCRLNSRLGIDSAPGGAHA